MRFVLNSVISAIAVWFVTILPFEVAVVGGEGDWWRRALVFLGVGALMALLNALVRPVLDFLSLPLRILTLGLFSLVVSWAMLWISAWVTQYLPNVELTLGGFWDTFWAALVISIITGVLGLLVPGARRSN